MKRTYKLFKLFLPIILATTCLSSIVGIFIFTLTFNPSSGIHFFQAAPIITFLSIVASVIISFAFLVKIKHTYITKMRRDSNALKFASALAFIVVFILTIYDFYRLLSSGMVATPAKVFKILRIVAAIPFLVYIVINALPKRMFRRKIVIPDTLQNISAIGAITWALFSILAIWFFDTPNHLTNEVFIPFKAAHILFYALFTIFIVSEIKAQLIKPSVKLHVATSLLLFVTMFPICFAIIIGNINDITITGISLFEYIAALALCIYALSKVFAYQHTIKFVMNTEKTTNQHRSHRHHHHHHTNSDEAQPSAEAEARIEAVEDTANNNEEENSTATAAEASQSKPAQIASPYQKSKNYPKSKSSKKKKHK